MGNGGPTQPAELAAVVRISYSKDSLLGVGIEMLAKMTAKNQLTLPKAITNAIGPTEYFDVKAKDGQIVLTPVRIQRADAVRSKLAELDIAESDIKEAVTWTRTSSQKSRR